MICKLLFSLELIHMIERFVRKLRPTAHCIYVTSDAPANPLI
jgi:hypothetical protein